MVSKKKQTPSRSPRRTAPDVEDYLASVPADTRAALMKLRKRIKAIVPTATEVISYQTPTSNTMVPSSPSRRSLTTAVSSSCAQLYRWPSSRRPLLRAVKDSQHLYFVVHFVNRDEGERREYELARTLNAASASTIRKGVERFDAFGLPGVRNRNWSRRCGHKCVRDHRRRLSSNGRASAAITPTHARGDFVMVEQPAFESGETALVDLTPEPFVVIHRAGQEV